MEYLNNQIRKLWMWVNYKSFMAGVECGKYEITDGPFISLDSIKPGEAAYWQKGGFISRKDNRVLISKTWGSSTQEYEKRIKTWPSGKVYPNFSTYVKKIPSLGVGEYTDTKLTGRFSFGRVWWWLSGYRR